MSWAPGVRLAVFDLDGTLYEGTRHFDYYASILAGELDPARGAAYLEEYRQARDGCHTLRVGRVYDPGRDLVLAPSGARVREACTWDGQALDPADVAALYPTPVDPEQHHLINIGDLWWIPPALGHHYGLSLEQAHQAFLETRRYMSSPGFDLPRVPGLREGLTSLRGLPDPVGLVLATNSAEPNSRPLLEKLGLTEVFDRCCFQCRKPEGLRELLPGLAAESGVQFSAILSVGDNYRNDIAPARRLGCRTAYIDPHGAGGQSDLRVRSVGELLPLLSRLGRETGAGHGGRAAREPSVGEPG